MGIRIASQDVYGFNGRMDSQYSIYRSNGVVNRHTNRFAGANIMF
jgi:hypothetical protein